MTGCRETLTKEEVISFFLRSVDEDDRYLFFTVSPAGRIIGESVINEIDWNLRCANYRICIFRSSERGKGIGTWAAEAARDFAFEILKLHRLELDVYSFSPRAEKAYLKAGFKKEGVRRDAVSDGDGYHFGGGAFSAASLCQKSRDRKRPRKRTPARKALRRSDPLREIILPPETGKGF